MARISGRGRLSWRWKVLQGEGACGSGLKRDSFSPPRLEEAASYRTGLSTYPRNTLAEIAGTADGCLVWVDF